MKVTPVKLLNVLNGWVVITVPLLGYTPSNPPNVEPKLASPVITVFPSIPRTIPVCPAPCV